jgi:hypothetical protein
MRVGLSYSVEIDEVPELLASLLEKAASQLRGDVLERLDDTVRSLKMKNPKMNGVVFATQELDAAKAALSKTDIVLADYINILQGYVSVVTQQLQEQVEKSPEMDTDSPPYEPTMAEEVAE